MSEDQTTTEEENTTEEDYTTVISMQGYDITSPEGRLSFLKDSHARFELMLEALSNAGKRDKIETASVRESLLSDANAVIADNKDIAELLSKLELWDDAVNKIIGESDVTVAIRFADELGTLFEYYGKFANYVIGRTISHKQKAARALDDSSETIKALMLEQRKNIDTGLSFAAQFDDDLISVAKIVPMKDDQSYAGELPKGGGKGSGRKSNDFVLEFSIEVEDNVHQILNLEPGRKVEEFIFTEYNPHFETRFSSVAEFEDELGHSVFKTPWTVGPFTCDKVEQK